MTAASAVAFQRYGTPSTKAPPAASQTAFVGVHEAAPKSMPAVTATWPRKLNQPVNHAHAAACDGASFAAQ